MSDRKMFSQRMSSLAALGSSPGKILRCTSNDSFAFIYRDA